MVEVLYNTIPTLPSLTSDEIHGDFREVWIESVYVPDLRVTVLFRFAKWQETDDCRMQALAGGPFLVADRGSDQVPDAPQPTA